MNLVVVEVLIIIVVVIVVKLGDVYDDLLLLSFLLRDGDVAVSRPTLPPPIPNALGKSDRREK